MHQCYTKTMPTTKHRVTLSPDARVNSALETLAKRRGKPVATISLELIERALELEEDLHFARVADARLEQHEARISHKDAWK